MKNAPIELRIARKIEYPCSGCGSDVRGKRLIDACSDCRTRVLETFWHHRAGKKIRRVNFSPYSFRMQRAWLFLLARRSQYPRSAYEFVLDAFSLAPRGRDKSIGARQLCEGIAELCRRTFLSGAEAREALLAWNIRSSEDVGIVVSQLLALQLASTEGISGPADFAGLFETTRWLG